MATKDFFNKIKHHTRLALLGLFLLISVGSIAAFYLFIKTHQLAAANFADDFLRPHIGTQATLDLEAFFFKLEDIANRAKYTFVKPPEQKFTFTAFKFSYSKLNNQLAPTPIPKLTNLPALSGEGVWTLINTGSGAAMMERTFVRPDPERDYALVSLVKMDMSKLTLGITAGTYEPGERAMPGKGYIPKNIQASNLLIAAFNGGFKRTDGEYGMIVGKDVYLPLKKNLATLVIYNDKKPQIVRFRGQNLGQDVVAIRQNGPMLLENGHDTTGSPAWNMQTWGLTTTNSMYTWRSGLGITKDGNIVYAAGSSLVPSTLARALHAAGAVNAMQLDINSAWVRFVLFEPKGNGTYTYLPLQKDLINGGYQYLHGYQKDFFYVYKNSSSNSQVSTLENPQPVKISYLHLPTPIPLIPSVTR
ncbi:MAG TPA: phosphodiester glycosidase family protein [Patescibacteria group bacterium]|nr:phosphodiester glycosidase family protein [Patescibacteria group bacterium]